MTTILVKHIKYNQIVKRFMQTSKPIHQMGESSNAPRVEINSQNNNNANQNVMPQIENNNEIQNERITTLESMLDNIEKRLGDKIKTPVSDPRNNMTNESEQITEPLYVAPKLNKEVILTNAAVQSTGAAIAEIGERFNLEIKKSHELNKQVKSDLKKLNDFIDSLSNIPWKRLLAIGACVITFGTIAIKMWMSKSVPVSEGLEMLSAITPRVSSVREFAPSKDTLDTSFKALVETPLSATMVITSIGAITIGLGILKAIVWVIRKTPK